MQQVSGDHLLRTYAKMHKILTPLISIIPPYTFKDFLVSIGFILPNEIRQNANGPTTTIIFIVLLTRMF